MTTVFERILAQAEAAKAATRAAQDGWWRDRALWEDQGGGSSRTEHDAIEAIKDDCAPVPQLPPVQIVVSSAAVPVPIPSPRPSVNGLHDSTLDYMLFLFSTVKEHWQQEAAMCTLPRPPRPIFHKRGVRV